MLRLSSRVESLVGRRRERHDVRVWPAVIDELVPESHSRGFERFATFGVVAGFAVMMLLDNAFG